MKNLNTQPASGTRDFLPEEVKRREWAFSTIKSCFESFSFLPMETPAFERVETLMGKYGEEGEKLIFKILKRGDQAMSGDTDLALRYDLTIPLVRFFSEYRHKLPNPFRRYQIGQVWRADRPGKGRFREFYQCDVDVVGSTSLLADAEVILALTKALSDLGLHGYSVRLNSRKVLTGLLESYDIPENLRQDTLITIDKLDKIGVEGVVKELETRGLSKDTIERIRKDLSGNNLDLKEIVKNSSVGMEGLGEVEELMSCVKPLLTDGVIEFSPFLARGLNYYTGPIFEIYLNGAPGAIASGGRYDNLVGPADKHVPACGGSLGIDRILSTLSTGEQDDANMLTPQVFVTVWDHDSRAEALRIATELRNNGIIVETALEEGKIKNQVRLASSHKARYCLFYGPDEIASNQVTIKNLLTGVQTSINREIASILEAISE